MKKIKVYLDNWVNVKKLLPFVNQWLITLIQFPLENKNKKIKVKWKWTWLTWDNNLATWNDLYETTWSDTWFHSDHYERIIKILWKENIKDIHHLEIAYNNKADFLITNDKDDIYNNKKSIESFLKFKILYQDSLEDLYSEIWV